ncbi:MAG: hypothetical protein AAGD86_08215 [Pseudomonadota bacterium]
MQADSHRPVRLKPITGSRSRVRIAAPTVQAEAAARVLGAVCPSVDVDLVTADDASAPLLWCPTADGALLGENGPERVTHVRALHPCLRATVRNLNVVLVAARQGDDGLATATFACRYARRMQRRRVTVLQPPTATGAPAWQAALTARFPDLVVDWMPLAHTVGQLAASRADFDVLVVPAESHGIVAAVATGLSGAPQLVTSAAPGTDGVALSAGADTIGSAQAGGLEALLLGSARLLSLTGYTAASMNLADAVLKTLEDGLHTPALALINPYTRRVDDAAVAGAVIDRLGGRPARLEPASRSAAAAKPRRPVLEVVRSA